MIRSVIRRWTWPVRSAFSFRTRRVLPAVLLGMVAGMVAVIALAVPALSGSGAPVSLDSSSSDSTDGTSPVVLGLDGRPTSGAHTSRQDRQPGTSAPAAGARTSTAAGGRTETGTSAATSGTPQTLAGSTGPTSSSSTSPSGSASSSAPSSSSPPSSSSSAPSSSSSSPPPPDGENTGTVLSLVNDARATAGCAALTADDALASSALANSTDMAAQGAPAVVDPAGTAAVVAAGQPDAGSVVSAWLADPTDKATLLDCGLTSAGLGKLHAAGDIWWTLFLA